jgi:hypothetical protein
VAVLPRPPARDLRQPDRALNRRGGHRAHHRRRATAPSRGGRHRRARDLCHSDVEFKDGSIPGVIDFMPIVLGREAAGVISAVGDDVKDWKVSDRAAVHPNDAGLATADADPIGTRRNGAYAERRRRPGNTNSSLYPTTSIPIRPLPRRTRHDRLQLPRSTVAGRLAGLGPGRLAQLAPSEPARRYHRARAGELIPVAARKLAPLATRGAPHHRRPPDSWSGRCAGSSAGVSGSSA